MKVCDFWTGIKQTSHFKKKKKVRKTLSGQVGEFSPCQSIVMATKLRWSVYFRRGGFTKWHGNAGGGSRKTEYVTLFPTLGPPTPYIKWRKRK